ncbi:MAG TPA: methyltransferase domain-containing protein, partial [Candidatus Cloacimonetes bacterium]|nr:methyltransferase domain-containing protein [Candidatus Cloacimonadota bacterium]
MKTCQVSYKNKIPVELPFGKTIHQFKNGHSITSDTAFLVEKVLENNSDKNLKVLELGSGNGIISIMLAHNRPSWNITGIEIQKKLVNLALENSKSAEVQIKFINADLKEDTFPPQNFDLIVSNPPYFPKKAGNVSPNKEKAISTHEILCTMEDVFRSVKYNLKKEGKAYLIYPLT